MRFDSCLVVVNQILTILHSNAIHLSQNVLSSTNLSERHTYTRVTVNIIDASATMSTPMEISDERGEASSTKQVAESTLCLARYRSTNKVKQTTSAYKGQQKFCQSTTQIT